MIGELMLMGEWQAILSKMLKGEFGEDGKQLFVQQYTGLKDKNGVEIYEGDIIINYISYSESLGGQIENSIGMVKWISREDKWDYSGWYAYPADLPWGDDDNNVEIIGNIFENNELLEK
jgi:uncharacterized phage protein (TIGR01671 family)